MTRMCLHEHNVMGPTLHPRHIACRTALAQKSPFFLKKKMKRHTKAKRRSKQQMQVVSWVLLVSCCSSCLGKTELLGERVGEAAGPPNTGGRNFPTRHIQCTHCDAWMSLELSVAATLLCTFDGVSKFFPVSSFAVPFPLFGFAYFIFVVFELPYLPVFIAQVSSHSGAFQCPLTFSWQFFRLGCLLLPMRDLSA